MWLSVAASVLVMGASWFIVYLVYSKVRHPDLVHTARRRFPDFMQVCIWFQKTFKLSYNIQSTGTSIFVHFNCNIVITVKVVM